MVYFGDVFATVVMQMRLAWPAPVPSKESRLANIRINQVQRRSIPFRCPCGDPDQLVPFEDVSRARAGLGAVGRPHHKVTSFIKLSRKA